MALTKEDIIAQEALKALSEEQIAAIATLSQNSEDELFRVKIGEHYRRLDASIEEHSGVSRNGDEKTYDYLPRAIDAMKAGYESKVSALNAELAALKEKSGGDPQLQAQIDSLTKELKTARDEYSALKTEYDGAKNDYAKALDESKIDSEISRALDAVTFKPGVNSEVLATIKEKAISAVKGFNPAFEEREGEKRLVFHENDSPMLNKENQLKPFTAKELLLREFAKYDVLSGKPKTGAGGKGNDPAGGNTIGASTQTEAMQKIEAIVLEKGFKKGTADYQAEVNKLWDENKVSSLPLR